VLFHASNFRAIKRVTDLLAKAFLDNAARQAGLNHPPELSEEALQALLGYSWPGNIRELRNMIERAVLLCGEATIMTRHLPTEKMRVTFSTSPARPGFLPTIPPRFGQHNDDEDDDGSSMEDTRGDIRAPQSNPVLRRGPKISVEEERAQIEAALQACGGNQTRAAKMLGIGRRTLINRVKEFGLARPRAR
jgi:two-component system response regulator AtoC